MSQDSLITPRLRLRNFQAEDLPQYIAMTQYRTYQRFYPDEDGTVSKANDLVRQFIVQSNGTSGSAYQLAICTRESARRDS